MQLCMKRKTFYVFFFAFFEYLKEKDDLLADRFLILRTAKNVVSQTPKMCRLKGPFNK